MTFNLTYNRETEAWELANPIKTWIPTATERAIQDVLDILEGR